MKKCIKCGSLAFNLKDEGIDQGDLCDVHYWQNRAEALAQPEQEPVHTAQISIVFYNGNSPLEESEVLRITKEGIKVNPAFKPDEAASAVLRALDSQIKNLMTRPEQEPVAWQVEVLIQGVWTPMGNPQRDKDRAEKLAANPSIPKECRRIIELYTPPHHSASR